MKQFIAMLLRDNMSKALALFCLVGGPLFQVAIYYTDKYFFGPNAPFTWGICVFTYSFYFAIVVPLSYFKRNSE
jgi:hypothetical protein